MTSVMPIARTDGVGLLDAAGATLDRESYVHLVMHAWAHPRSENATPRASELRPEIERAMR